MVRICFVCLGNICRSPTAEGVMRWLVAREGLVEHVGVESAGTGDWHVGERPDARSREAAERRGIALESTARHFHASFFERCDYVIAMDRSNRRNLLRLAPSSAAREKVHLLRAFDPASPPDAEVPDPYYGGPSGFDEVLDLCEAGCRGLVAHLRRAHGIP